MRLCLKRRLATEKMLMKLWMYTVPMLLTWSIHSDAIDRKVVEDNPGSVVAAIDTIITSEIGEDDSQSTELGH